MKLVICTKFQVNRTNCVESRRGEGVLEASCDNFFFEASRVKMRNKIKIAKTIKKRNHYNDN